MANCEPNTTLGKAAFLEYQIACLDVEPSETWKKFGAVRTKSVTNGGNTVDTTADDSKGMYNESIVTSYTKEFSLDGIIRNSGDSKAALIELYSHWNDPKATGGQPVLWVKFTDPTGVETAPVVITGFDKSAPHDDVITYSLTLSVTSSPIGVKFVADEPSGD